MALCIKKDGIFTSLQNLGEFGLQGYGINPRGAMDQAAARIVNLLLGNDENDPLLEIHFPGGELEFESDCRFAIGGADFAARLDGDELASWRTHQARASNLLRFREKKKGNRCYLAVGGGLRLSSTARAYSTVRLTKGDRLHFESGSPDLSTNSCVVSPTLIPPYSSFPTVRIVAGGEFERLSPDNIELLTSETFVIANESNRMGFRLRGPAISTERTTEMVSAAVNFGTIQLLPDGQLIVLMADHQTSGGYPRIANIITADLPLIGQLGPNDKVTFKLVDVGEAEQAAMQFERDLKKLRIGVALGRSR